MLGIRRKRQMEYREERVVRRLRTVELFEHFVDPLPTLARPQGHSAFDLWIDVLRLEYADVSEPEVVERMLGTRLVFDGADDYVRAGAA